MILAEGWHNADIDSADWFGTPDSLDAWPTDPFLYGFSGVVAPSGAVPCGNAGNCPGTTPPEWDDAARELMIAEEGGQGSAVDQAQVKVREVVTCYRWIRPKDITDGFAAWPGAGNWTWKSISAYHNTITGATGDSPPPNADPLTSQWLLGSEGQVFTQIQTRTSGLEHPQVSGELTWNKRWPIWNGVTGRDSKTYYLGIKTYKTFDAELAAREQDSDFGDGNLYGLKMSDVDWVGYKDDPTAFYYDGWERINDGTWLGPPWETVFWLKRIYPNGHLDPTDFNNSGGVAPQRRLLRTDFELPDYTLPDGVGLVSGVSWSTTNLDAKKRLAWFWEPRFHMRAYKGETLPADPADLSQYPAGDSDRLDLDVWGESWAMSSSSIIPDPTAGIIQNSNVSSISHSQATYTWDGTTGDLPSMGTYAYNIRPGTWPTDGTGGTGPFTMNNDSRLRCGPTYNVTSAGSPGLPVGVQGWWPQTRPQKTDSPYEWPMNMRYLTNTTVSSNVIPAWRGVPTVGPEVYTSNSLPVAWVVDDVTIDGVDCEVCTSKPHLHAEYTIGNWD
jgi:hypothetical protein